jgi:hypothetical protein
MIAHRSARCRGTPTLAAAVFLCVSGSGCGDSGDVSRGNTTGTGADGAGANASSGSGGSGTGAGGSGTGADGSGAGTGTTAGGTSSGSGGSASNPGDPIIIEVDGGTIPLNPGGEACDGIDNDGDGIIDNLDVDSDGICDCLNIATVGAIGNWGSGNVFTVWLSTRGAKPADELGDQVLTPELLAPYQVIVLLNVSTVGTRDRGKTYPGHHAFSQSEIDALEQWVDAGGGVMATIGYQGDEVAEMKNVNTLLSFASMGYDPDGTAANGTVKTWAPHPVTNNMGVAEIVNGVSPLTTAGTTVGWDDSDRVAYQVRDFGNGHIAVWGDEWITYDALWNDVKSLNIELLWLNTFKWLTPVQECQVPIPPPIF